MSPKHQTIEDNGTIIRKGVRDGEGIGDEESLKEVFIHGEPKGGTTREELFRGPGYLRET